MGVLPSRGIRSEAHQNCLQKLLELRCCQCIHATCGMGDENNVAAGSSRPADSVLLDLAKLTPDAISREDLNHHLAGRSSRVLLEDLEHNEDKDSNSSRLPKTTN